MKRFILILGAFSMMLLAGCTVGPRYTRPTAPTAPTDTFKEANGWKPAQPSDQLLRGNWWEMFGDPQLNALESEVTVSNQDLKVANARFVEARAMVHFNRAAQFPTISTSPGIEQVRYSANTPLLPGNSFTGLVLPFDLSYELDVWGRVRRTVSASREEAQATAGDLATVNLSLHAELAYDYFELRSADAQKQLLDDTVKTYQVALQLTVDRFEGGAAPKSDVAQARTQLQTTMVQDTDIAVQRAEFEHAIAVLIGKPPAAFSLPASPLNLVPPDILPGLPSQLLERRPDIAAAERRVAGANDQIGIARAAYYPTVILSASAGFEGDSITNWFTWPSRFWAVGPSALETLFDAGRRRATSNAALANYDATVANYRENTLTAFQQVEDNLAALRILSHEAQQQKEATASAEESLQIFTNRYIGGRDPYLQVLTAQTIALQNERNDVDILRRRMDASVLLIKALGGGWTVSEVPKTAELR
ncbi:MAG TPA: efflux transporter outer membrane subunit [Candidatus Acidoferrales bacterium]|jgi:NodT family efflux transporter outer membrane factor (OMF) lipoprotein|nr:efflux transporter outer membrane subunit [Candidatus Acidoferrales bacterium]